MYVKINRKQITLIAGKLKHFEYPVCSTYTTLKFFTARTNKSKIIMYTNASVSEGKANITHTAHRKSIKSQSYCAQCILTNFKFHCTQEK